jgi:hypothetical protein
MKGIEGYCSPYPSYSNRGGGAWGHAVKIVLAHRIRSLVGCFGFDGPQKILVLWVVRVSQSVTRLNPN